MENDFFISSFLGLKNYCEKENYKGWDPYDGLNSKLLWRSPFKDWEIIQFIWIQVFKQNPINLRKLFLIPKDYNAKSIALFLTGYCNLYRMQNDSISQFENKEQLLEKIHFLSNLLIQIQSKGYSGACWGYNFDWKSKAFFLPAHTPTIVVTSFAVEAMLNAYGITKIKELQTLAFSSADFILNDINRISKTRGFMFSYSPVDNRAVYNASLLGTKTLALIYEQNHSQELKKTALESAQAVCDMQNVDGSFPHSDQVGNKWRDSFHTGFKLESLFIFQKCCNEDRFTKNINIGFHYWLENFFNKDTGLAYYYDNGSELIDLHCAAQSLTTLYKLDKLTDEEQLANKILYWAIMNMQDKKGYFYFQKRRLFTNKIPYMRWPNAWMFYGMSYYLLFKSKFQ
jgi:hypothetical protein